MAQQMTVNYLWKVLMCVITTKVIVNLRLRSCSHDSCKFYGEINSRHCEIKLCEQQYEYYRDLLLRFPKAVAESVEKQNGWNQPSKTASQWNQSFTSSIFEWLFWNMNNRKNQSLQIHHACARYSYIQVSPDIARMRQWLPDDREYQHQVFLSRENPRKYWW
jgi:hypothetical protein